MATPLRLRDRDAVVTREGLIFRVFGYSHPSNAYVCDVEYAPAYIYQSAEPRAFRAKGRQVYYKFYADEGLRFVQEKYPQYTIWHEPLKARLVGVRQNQIVKTRKPNEKFLQLLKKPPLDSLLRALHTLFDLISERSELSKTDFGVFGSLLHDFYHPKFSDLDLIVYGGRKLQLLCGVLEALYMEEDSSLRNEFEGEEVLKGKHWKFVNYSPQEHLWHQRRKILYALFEDKKSGRIIKTEFEPVKEWNEIHNEYDPKTRIVKKGWVKAVARITDDSDAAFMPSIYRIEPIKILNEAKVEDVQRIVSYVEEFRMQARKDEKVYVEGNLEQVATAAKTFHQITLTYGPRYYEQVLKIVKLPM